MIEGALTEVIQCSTVLNMVSWNCRSVLLLLRYIMYLDSKMCYVLVRCVMYWEDVLCIGSLYYVLIR